MPYIHMKDPLKVQIIATVKSEPVFTEDKKIARFTLTSDEDKNTDIFVAVKVENA